MIAVIVLTALAWGCWGRLTEIKTLSCRPNKKKNYDEPALSHGRSPLQKSWICQHITWLNTKNAHSIYSGYHHGQGLRKCPSCLAVRRIVRTAVCSCPTLQFAVEEVCSHTQNFDNTQIYLYTLRLSSSVTCYNKPPKTSLKADYVKVFTANILAICCIRIISMSINIYYK